MKKPVQRKNSQKSPFFTFLLLVLAIIVGFISYMYFTVKKYDNLILAGVKIGVLDVGGKTKDEATNFLKEKYGDTVRDNKITIKTKEKDYYINYSSLDPKYDIKAIVEKAFLYGKDGNIFKRYTNVIKKSGKNFMPKITYNSQPIKDVIKEIEKEVNKQSKDATINAKESGEIEVVPEQLGQKLLSDKLEQKIGYNINKSDGGSFKINAPIDLQKPKVTKEALKSVDSLISSFSTSYGSSTFQRATNIKLAADNINGTVLMPGEEFSFNNVVGERTAEKGYKSAGVIVGNKLESGVGGGVCQVSSTLYNAILKTGLSSVQRSNHSFPSSYVRFGMDATVDYGSIDYKFKNTFNYPVYIQAYTKGRVVGFNIYSNKSLKNRTYTLENSIYQTIEPTVQYKDDPNLEEGKTEQIQPPHTGYKVKVYRNIFENGSLIKKELVSDDFYRAVNAIVKRGTKKPEEKPKDEKDKDKNKEKDKEKDKDKGKDSQAKPPEVKTTDNKDKGTTQKQENKVPEKQDSNTKKK